VVWEYASAYIVCRDNSAKLTINFPLTIALGPSVTANRADIPTVIPYTYPASTAIAFIWTSLMPAPPYLPSDGLLPNGPLAQVLLTNTDGAGPHTYRRNITYFYRYIYDIDWTKERVYVMGTLT
jgi:hypothetical protein